MSDPCAGMRAAQCRREAEALWRVQRELLLRAFAADKRADELEARELRETIEARELRAVREMFGPKVTRRVA